MFLLSNNITLITVLTMSNDYVHCRLHVRNHAQNE